MRPSIGICWVLFPLIWILSGCGTPAADTLYYLTPDGDFKPVSNPTGLPTSPLKPWPSQVRVTQTISLGKIFLAVNRCGLAQVEPDGQVVKTFYSPDSFGGRTLAGLYPEGDRVWCHVYSETSFGEIPPPIRFGFVRINLTDPRATDRLICGLQLGDHPWEAVMVWPLENASLAIQWKETRSDQTVFRYTKLDRPNGEETEKEKSWFMRSCGLGSIQKQSADPRLSKLMAEVLAQAGPDDTVLAAVTLANGLKQHYLPGRASPGSTDRGGYLTVRVFENRQGWLALFPDGRLLRFAADASEPKTDAALPALAAGYRYTDIAETDTVLCASWEQADFFKIGIAGIVVRLTS